MPVRFKGKVGEVGPRVRGTLTSSMFGNLTGTYPGIQAAFYEPERQLKATQFGHVGFRSDGPARVRPWAGTASAPRMHQFPMRSKRGEVGSGTLTSQCEVGARMLPFLTALHP